MSSIKEGFGLRIKAVRLANSMTQLDFARKVLAGTTTSSTNIGRLEKERNYPRLDTLQRIAKATNTDINFLTDGYPVDKKVGQRVATARQEAGLSALALAKSSKLGATSQNVLRIENGSRTPTFGTIVKIAEALNVSPMKLAFGQ